MSLVGGVPQHQVSVEPGQPQSSYSKKAGTGHEEAGGLTQSGEAMPYSG